MIKTNRELHNLVDRFVDTCNSSNTIDTYSQDSWFDLIIDIYRSRLPFSAKQFANLLVTGGLSKTMAWQASVEYFNACQLLKKYEEKETCH